MGPTREARNGRAMYRRIVLLATALLVAGCAIVKVEQANPRQYLAARRGDVLSTGELSQATASALFASGMSVASCSRNRDACIERLA